MREKRLHYVKSDKILPHDKLTCQPSFIHFIHQDKIGESS